MMKKQIVASLIASSSFLMTVGLAITPAFAQTDSTSTVSVSGSVVSPTTMTASHTRAQKRLLVTINRIRKAVAQVNAVGIKLQARVTSAQTGGKDVTALTASLSDITSQMNDATSQYQSAISAVDTLVADKGDKTKIASNQAILVSIRASVKAANTDLKSARKDIQSIRKGLKTLKA